MSPEGRSILNMENGENQPPEVIVETIAPEGLGYGEGGISVQARLTEGSLSPETIDKVAQASKSSEATVAVSDVSYDTCPDGRCASCIQRIEDGQVIESKDPTYCYKVFGGGVTMGMSGSVANGKEKGNGVFVAFTNAVSRFKQKKIDFGVHSSNHAGGEKSDCGAIDNAPKIYVNTLKYRKQITATMGAVFGPNAEEEQYKKDLDEVYGNIEDFVTDNGFKKENYSGADVVGMIAEDGYPVKVLADNHLEVRVRVNVDVDDYTTDQQFIRTKTGEEAQIFAVDVPRMKELADLDYDDVPEKRKAFLGMMVYSLATAATLTAGDLPVDKVYKKYPNPAPIFKSEK